MEAAVVCLKRLVWLHLVFGMTAQKHKRNVLSVRTLLQLPVIYTICVTDDKTGKSFACDSDLYPVHIGSDCVRLYILRGEPQCAYNIQRQHTRPC
eukprot:6188082-Pleurochrysis_carterae.AAC.6